MIDKNIQPDDVTSIQIVPYWSRTICLSSIQKHTDFLMFSTEEMKQQSKARMHKTRAPGRPDEKSLYGVS